VERIKPDNVIVDPITNLIAGSGREIYSMLLRLMDFLKGSQITTIFTSLTSGGDDPEQSEVGVSSLIDTWLLCRDVELNGERNRCLYVLKSRGMAHSNQVREFVLSREGIKLIPAYIGDGLVLTGSSRLAQEAKEKADSLIVKQEIERKKLALEQKRIALEAQIKALQSEFAAEERELDRIVADQQVREEQVEQERETMSRRRMESPNKRSDSVMASVAGGAK
jgi:circadian clock protein KaiC